MSKGTKFCPMIKSQCIEENCAIFDIVGNGCALVSIAGNVKGVNETLEDALESEEGVGVYVRGSIDTYEQNA